MPPDLTDAPEAPADPPAFFDLVDTAEGTLPLHVDGPDSMPTLRDRAVIVDDAPATVPDFSETLRRIERLEGRA